MEDGEVVELFVERERSRTMVGNIYKGRVQRVLPGMQSAFVDIGLEKDGFLYVSDFHEELEEFENETEETDAPPPAPPPTAIEDMLKPGREILVQVAKAQMETKGARITSHITLAGRYLVYMPTVEHNGVSRKINSSEERGRLRSILKRHRSIAPGGFIVRTAADGKSEEEIVADMSFLARTWEEARRKGEGVSAPACVYREPALPERLLRDVVGSDISTVRIDNDDEYLRLVEFLEDINPPLARRVKLHTGSTDILDDFGISGEIEKSLKSRVWLKSGGYLVINQTEALVAIDVNTGKFVGKRNFEETICQTNIEATKEVVRQIRLRNLGGILVLDLIDMEDRKNRNKVMRSLEAELSRDRQPNVVLPINDFGLALITRKRVQSSLEKTLCSPCPYCSGSGRVKSVDTVSYAIAREATRTRESLTGREVVIRVHPDVAQALKSSERALARALEKRLKKAVTIQGDPGLHREQYFIATVS